MNGRQRLPALFLGIVVLIGAGTSRAASVMETFDDGSAGWAEPGPLSAVVGNPAPSLHFVAPFADFWYFSTTTNAAFLGNYERYGRLELGLDVRTIEAGLTNFVVELIDFGPSAASSLDDASVWHYFGELGDSNWTTYSVVVDDPTATDVPPGWRGASQTHNGLPPGRTFASVLASVDKVEFSTGRGIFVGDGSAWDIAIDNIFIRSTPALGDATGDGFVDRADVAILASNFGTSEGATFARGDFNDDLRVNLLDLAILQGQLNHGALGSSRLGGAAVPEPNACVLASALLMCLAVVCRPLRMKDRSEGRQ